MASAFDDLFGGGNQTAQSSASAFDDLFGDKDYGYSSNEPYNSQEDYSNYESEADSHSAFDDLFSPESKSEEPKYSVQETAQQANGGQSYLGSAVSDVTGQQQLSLDDVKASLEKIASTTEDKQLAKMISKYTSGEAKADDFLGQFSASYGSGKINELSNQAWGKYAKSVRENGADKADANLLQTAQAYDTLAQYFTGLNANALDNENRKAGLISKDFAQYLPQLYEQTKAGAGKIAKGALAGAAIGELATPFPGIDALIGGVTGGIVAGGKVGGVAASAAYSYDTMLGAATKDLIEAGASTDDAAAAAGDEATLSAAIESLDTAIDLFSLIPGVGSALKAVSIEALEKGAGAYIKNIASEYGEEFAQELISVANERRVGTGQLNSGIPGLTQEIKNVITEVVQGVKNGDGDAKEVLDRLREAGRGGAGVAATMGIAAPIAYNVVTAPFQQRTNTNVNAETNTNVQENEQNTSVNEAVNEKETTDVKAEPEQQETALTTEEQIAELQTALETYKENGASPVVIEAIENEIANLTGEERTTSPTTTETTQTTTPTTEAAPKVEQKPATTTTVPKASEQNVDQSPFTWDNKSYKGYSLEFQNEYDGDTVYDIVSPDGRKVGTATLSDLPGETTSPDEIMAVIDNDISKNGVDATVSQNATQTASETPAQSGNENPQPTTQKSSEAPSGELNSESDTAQRISDLRTAVEAETNPRIKRVLQNELDKLTGTQGQNQQSTQQNIGQNQSPMYDTSRMTNEEIDQRIADLETALSNETRPHVRSFYESEINRLRNSKTFNRPNNNRTTGTNGSNATTGGTAQPYIPKVNDTGPSKQKVSQTSTNSERVAAEQSGNTQKKLYYTTKSEYESLSNATARVAADKTGEMERLAHKENWTGEDADTAQIIKNQLDAEFANSETPDPELEKAIDALGKLIQQHTTESAQAVQARAKWARTGANALIDIFKEIDDNKDLSAEDKLRIKHDVAKFMTEFDKIKPKGADDADAAARYRKLILEQNKYRNTGTFSGKRFEKLLNKETDVNWLKEYAYRQALNIPTDYTRKSSLGQQLKTWQVCAQLSRVGTFFRNLGGNLSFGCIDTFAQDSFGYAIDNLIAKKTGRKEVGFDKGWLNKNAKNSAIKAFERSVLETAGDVDMTGDANRYGQGSSRTNKMVGSKVEQAMSRWEQLLGYSLTSSDRFFRGQIEQSVYDAVMKDNPNMTEEEARQIAKITADYRLFQNNGRAAQFSKGVHDVLNKLGSVGNDETGRFGLGDLINPYPGVPANLAVKALEYSPLNIIKGAKEVFQLLKDVEEGKAVAGQQMTAVMDIARGMAGVPIIALFTALAKSGLFKNSDDEDDYDVMAENAAQNLSGVQLNLSAILRRFDGEEADWKDGDTIMKVSWLEPINAFMSIGSMLAESDEDHDLESMSSTFFEGALQAALDMPVMENIQNAINTFKYSQGDSLWQKLGEAGAQFAGDAVGGMIPAPISQTARVMDDYVRDTKGNNKTETAINALYNSLPGLRNTLPIKTENFGNARENEPDMYNRIMNSFIRPGSISTYRETDVQDEIRRLYDSNKDVALYPDRAGPKSLKIDGVDYKLTAEDSRTYHEFVGKKSEEYVKALIHSKAYSTLTDEQKTEAIKEMYTLAKGLAKDFYASAYGIQQESLSNATMLLGGVDKPGVPNDKTPLNDKNLANYVTYSQAFEDALKSADYKQTDNLAKWYSGMDDNLKTVLLERNTDLKRILEYQKIGLGSETYDKIKAAIPDAQYELDANSSTSSLVRLYGVAKADIPEKDRLNVLENLVQGKNGFIGSNAKAAVETLQKYGLSVEQTAQFFDIALHCATKKDTGEAKDFKGKLTPENTAYALMQIPGLSDAQRSAAYNSIKSQVSNYYNDWGNYTYTSEVKWFTNPKNKVTYGTNIKISPANGLIPSVKR